MITSLIDPPLIFYAGKEKKRVDKSVASSKASLVASASGVSADVLRQALEQVKNEEIPVASEQREAYFMSQVGLGEQLANRGMLKFFELIRFEG